MDSQTQPSTARFIIWLLCPLGTLGLTFLWGQLPELDSRPLLRVGLFAGIGLLLIPLTFLFPDLSRKRSTCLLIAAAILLRITLLPAPVSDDTNRYLWEGKLVLSGENPYATLADDPVREPFRDDFWPLVNHRDRPTAYPPGIQWVFAAAVAIDYHPWTMKALALFGDLVTLGLLVILLGKERSPVRWAGLYAFNPITLMSFAAEAHFDSLMVAALAGTLLAHRNQRPVLTWLLFGFAVQIKFICIILAPLLLTKRNAFSSWVLAAMIILPSLPFLDGLGAWWNGVTTFGGSGFFNGPMVSFLSLTGLPLDITRSISIAIFGLAALTCYLARWRGFSLIDTALVLLSALLICSPIIHFWYLAWLLPFAALRPSFGWTTASICMAGYFVAWWTQDEHGWWGFSHTFAAALWTLPLLAFVLQNRATFTRVRRSFGRPKAHSSTPRIDLVIPTLNAGERIKSLVEELRESIPPASQIIIADGGSTDHSLEDIGTKIVHSDRGRGEQIATGIAESEADWTVIIHADAIPGANWYHHLVQTIQSHSNASMLVFGQRFTPARFSTLLIELLNEVRVVFGGVAFGDQTMVIRRSALDASGGFPAQPLMEDVEASLRLLGHGRLVYMGNEWQVSSVKWQSQFATRFLLIIRLMTTYQFARLRGRSHAAEYSRKLYGDYYK